MRASASPPVIGKLSPEIIGKFQSNGHLLPIDPDGQFEIVCADRRPIHSDAINNLILPTSGNSVPILGAAIGLSACAAIQIIQEQGVGALEDIVRNIGPQPVIALAALASTDPNSKTTHLIHSSTAEETSPVGFHPGSKDSEAPDCYFMRNFAALLSSATSKEVLTTAEKVLEIAENPSGFDAIKAAREGIAAFTARFPKMSLTRRELLPHTTNGFDVGVLAVVNVVDTGPALHVKQPLIVDLAGTDRVKGAYHHSVAGVRMAVDRMRGQLPITDSNAATSAGLLLGAATALRMKADIGIIQPFNNI